MLALKAARYQILQRCEKCYSFLKESNSFRLILQVVSKVCPKVLQVLQDWFVRIILQDNSSGLFFRIVLQDCRRFSKAGSAGTVLR